MWLVTLVDSRITVELALAQKCGMTFCELVKLLILTID